LPILTQPDIHPKHGNGPRTGTRDGFRSTELLPFAAGRQGVIEAVTQ
jgi:hypothetical protein